MKIVKGAEREVKRTLMGGDVGGGIEKDKTKECELNLEYKLIKLFINFR